MKCITHQTASFTMWYINSTCQAHFDIVIYPVVLLLSGESVSNSLHVSCLRLISAASFMVLLSWWLHKTSAQGSAQSFGSSWGTRAPGRDPFCALLLGMPHAAAWQREFYPKNHSLPQSLMRGVESCKTERRGTGPLTPPKPLGRYVCEPVPLSDYKNMCSKLMWE